MSLLDSIRRDVQLITSNANEFGVSMTLTDPNGTTATITGLHTKHYINVDTDGNPINAKNASISFCESIAVAAGYTIRNNKAVVDLKNHKVTVKDSTGNSPTYIIREWFPDEKLGLIVCILGDIQ